jgi:hypothetical protein
VSAGYRPAQQRPAPSRGAVRLSWTLGALTFLTTALTGALYFTRAGEAAVERIATHGLAALPAAFGSTALAGLPFAASLMLFFLCHELGHFIACRRYGVACTPPYFIPAPLLLFGTLGAVIRIRGPIPDRRVLFDIGMAGPFAGFPVALALVVIGLLRADEGALPEPGSPVFGHSLLTLAVARSLGIGAGSAWLPEDPVLVAGWVGLLATAMNLVPAGQLDGGHAAFALAPHYHRIVSVGAGVFIASLALARLALFGEYSAWSVWAVIVLLFGRRHPPVMYPSSGIGRTRQLAAAAGVVVLVLCFMPHPLAIIP